MNKKNIKRRTGSIFGCILGYSIILSLNIDNGVAINKQYEFKNTIKGENPKNPLELRNKLNKNVYVTIPDAELKKAFNKSLGRTNLDADLTMADMEEIRYVKWVDGNISNIDGVQYAVNMNTFDIYGNNVSDLNPLRNHPKLEVLYLNKNPIEDVTPISTLSKLNHLRLDNTLVSDLSSLESLKGLWTLRISDTKVSNFDFLKKLTVLKELHMDGLGLNDLKMLECLPQLEHLQFHFNNVTDISPVAKMINLKTLSLNGNNVSSLEDIINLNALETLEIGRNPISDISPLENKSNLKRLIMYSIGSDNLDITPLKNKEKLEILQMNSNGITNIDVLTSSTNLKELNIEDNKIVDISVLRNMTKMEKLDMTKNGIEDISAISNMIALNKLHIDSNKINDIRPLTNLVKIVELRMQKNNIEDISSIANLTKIVELKMGYNQVKNVSVLSNLILVEELEIYENSIVDLSPLKKMKNLKKVRVERQKGTLDELIAHRANISTPIPFKDVNSQPVELTSIGSGGYQSNGKIYYDNIAVNSSFVSKLVFDKQIDINGTLYRFSGEFKLPVRTLDITAPTATITHIPDGWTNGSITLVIKARDEYSGVKSIKLPDGNLAHSDYAEYIVHDNGAYEIEIEDKVGNRYKINHVVNSIDKEKPVVELSIGNINWENNTGIIEINTYDNRDGSGIKELLLPDGTTINQIDENNNIIYSYIGEIGSEYTFRGIDKAGNYSENKIALDVYKVLVDITGNPTEWTNKDVSLNLKITDTRNVVKEVILPDGNTTTKKEVVFNVTVNGDYVFKVVDIYGKEIVETVSVTKIDKVLPEIEYTVNFLGENERRIEVTAYDELSGLESIIDSEGNILNNTNTIIFDASSNGNYYIVARDKANNVKNVNIKIDDILNDYSSGIERIEYKIDGKNEIDWTKYIKKITLSNEGIYTLYARAIDRAGNQSSIKKVVLKIDKSEPNVVYAVQYNNEKTSAEVTVVGTDELSGVKHFVGGNNNIYNSSTYTFTVAENGVYLTTAYDNAGNISIVPIEVDGLNGESTNSGIQKIEYKMEGSVNQDWSIYQNAITISKEGVTIVTARSYDNAGNVSDEIKLEVKIDKTKPQNNKISVKVIE